MRTRSKVKIGVLIGIITFLSIGIPFNRDNLYGLIGVGFIISLCALGIFLVLRGEKKAGSEGKSRRGR